MTDEASAPPHPASPDEAQASLREELAGQIAAAQSRLETELAALLRTSAGGDAALTEKLRGQLHVLHALGQSLAGADAATLVQLSAEVATSVTASQSIAEQAQAEIATAASEDATMRAEYAAATADIDHRVAPALITDRENNALAHALAKRFGVDLGNYDRERTALERQREQAVASGDKVGERKADVLVAENSLHSLQAAGRGITDPAEQASLDERVRQQQRAIDTLKAAYEAQLELEARKKAQQQGLSPEETSSYVARQKAEGMADLDGDARSLVGTEYSEVTRSAMRASLRSNADTKVKAPPALDHVAAALTPQAKLATQQAADAISATAANYASDPTLGISITLDTAPQAHSKVEMPQLAAARPAAAPGQSVA